MAVKQGGGGGRAGDSFSETDDFAKFGALDLTHPPTSDNLQQLMDYLRDVEYAIQRLKAIVTKADGEFINQVSSQHLLGRYAGSDGPIQEISIGARLTLSAAGVLSADVQSGGSGITLQRATATITAAQMNTGNTVPIQVIAAPGAGKINIPLVVTGGMRMDGSGAAFSTGQSGTLRYATSDIALVSLGTLHSNGLTGYFLSWCPSIIATTGNTSGQGINEAIEFATNVASTGGHGSYSLDIGYVEMTLPT